MADARLENRFLRRVIDCHSDIDGIYLEIADHAVTRGINRGAVFVVSFEVALVSGEFIGRDGLIVASRIVENLAEIFLRELCDLLIVGIDCHGLMRLIDQIAQGRIQHQAKPGNEYYYKNYCR